jgi:8-oxo-dGTP pyrophosphatase MutT (NUDIX family)
MPAMNSVQDIAQQLAGFQPTRSPERHTSRRSAVTLLLRDQPASGAEVLMIERAHREGDPWSGHMGFPGGRMDPGDRHSFAAATRETHEEIGLDVERHGRLLGRLSDMSTHIRSGRSAMLVTPYVFSVAGEPALRANYEVADILWVPLGFLAETANRQQMDWQYDGTDLQLPCYYYEGRCIWGLSLAMLDEFLGVAGMARFESRRIGSLRA